MTATVASVGSRRAATGASARTLTGTPVVYNTPTVIPTPFGSFEEMIAPGALTRALTGSDGAAIALLRDHNSSLLLGRQWSGSLALTDSMVGLRMEAKMPETPLGRETYTLVDRGDLRGMSFAFAIAEGGDTWHEPTKRGGLPMRVIREIRRLYEVSICSFPAYESTTVAVAGRTRTRADIRRSMLDRRIAMDGGWPTGQRTMPSRELWGWCHRHPGRVGTKPCP